ncbi:hypothetical protein HN670_00960 [bacterium]|jgi:hypothetical protein|nr:hypothetical protein [bacterium]
MKLNSRTAVLFAVANKEKAVEIAVRFPSQAVAISQALPYLAKEIASAVPEKAAAIAENVAGSEETLTREFGRAASRFFKGATTQISSFKDMLKTRGKDFLADFDQHLESLVQEPESTVVDIAVAHPDQAVKIAKSRPEEAVAIARALPDQAAEIARVVPSKAAEILEAVSESQDSFKL